MSSLLSTNQTNDFSIAMHGPKISPSPKQLDNKGAIHAKIHSDIISPNFFFIIFFFLKSCSNS